MLIFLLFILPQNAQAQGANAGKLIGASVEKMVVVNGTKLIEVTFKSRAPRLLVTSGSTDENCLRNSMRKGVPVNVAFLDGTVESCSAESK